MFHDIKKSFQNVCLDVIYHPLASGWDIDFCTGSKPAIGIKLDALIAQPKDQEKSKNSEHSYCECRNDDFIFHYCHINLSIACDTFRIGISSIPLIFGSLCLPGSGMNAWV